MKRGWHSRGYVPHYDVPGVVQHLTFRLKDSVPASMLRRMDVLLDAVRSDPDELTRMRSQVRHMVEVALDGGRGECLLARPDVADVVERALLAGDGTRYRLLAWTVMPNHVHAIFDPKRGCSIALIVQRWKGGSSRVINAALGRKGALWDTDYFDRFVRDADDLARTVRYVEQNPVKAGLCERARDWRYGSASREGWTLAALRARGLAGAG